MLLLYYGIQHNELEVRRFGERQPCHLAVVLRGLKRHFKSFVGLRFFFPYIFHNCFFSLGLGGVDGGGRRFQK